MKRRQEQDIQQSISIIYSNIEHFEIYEFHCHPFGSFATVGLEQYIRYVQNIQTQWSLRHH